MRPSVQAFIPDYSLVPATDLLYLEIRWVIVRNKHTFPLFQSLSTIFAWAIALLRT